MKQKLFYLGCAFVFMWTLGEVLKTPYRQNLVQAITMTIAYAIYLGLHTTVWDRTKSLWKKE